MGGRDIPNGDKKLEFGGRALTKPNFLMRASPSFFKLFWAILIALEAS